MIKIYSNNIKENILIQMYNILIENLFITYPKFLEEKEKHDNKENYKKWSNMIINTNNYYVINYFQNNEIIGFLNFCIIDKELWISEVQIKNKYKNKKIMKSLIKYFTSLNICNNYKSVTIHINKDNILSKKVFSHIGFKSIGNTLYKIEIINLKKWSNM